MRAIGWCVVGLLGAASMAHAQQPAPAPPKPPEMPGYAISYTVTIGKTPGDVHAEAQLSESWTRTCEAWSYGGALYYVIDKGIKGRRNADQPFSDKANIYNERLNYTESLDGDRLGYRAQYMANSRGDPVEGAAFFGGPEKKGLLQVRVGKVPREVALPPGNVGPMTFRRLLLEQLRANHPGPWYASTVDLVRFQMPIDLKVERTSPAPFRDPITTVGTLKDAPAPDPKAPKGKAAPGAGQVREMPAPLKGRRWVLKQTSKMLGERGEVVYEMFDSGVIPRLNFKREGIELKAVIKDLTEFPNPKCD
ncbi:MAG: hypothetical protein KF889_10340 [Alphaproteobacteria bacterium]|nr:hypothetical protein [Alphaproteobacteria bacterium]MCW5741222.1 hypothetical protein [Alphaproteobacteria bacterium]